MADKVFDPASFLEKNLPKSFFDGKILTKGLTLRKADLKAIVTSTTLSGKQVTAEVLRVLKIYQQKINRLREEGETKVEATEEALNDEKLLKNRLEGLIIYTEVEAIKEKYKGREYRWLPSSSVNPDPDHQLLYGKVFPVGKGDKDGNMPGIRYGCKCGIEII